MNMRRIMTVARKDLMEVRGNKSVWLPMLIVPVVFMVLMPLFFGFFSDQIQSTSGSDLVELQAFMVRMPPAMMTILEGHTESQQVLIFILGFFMAPMFLILPLMFSSIIAAESFAGEKERKTLEGLLYTPASDQELFLGKVVASASPAILISWISFLVYVIVITLSTNDKMGGAWFPLPGWYPLVFWVAPAIAILGTMFTVLISSRVKTFMEAYQNGAMLVLLVLGLVAGQMTGVLYLGVEAGLLIGAICWGLNFILARMCIRLFKRSRWIASAA